jgi:predicted AlkP superfamily phosphohydrolase/phosphomutase
MPHRNKILILGLDGATWTVLKPWIDDGSLPNLAALLDKGCWGELRSTIPPLTAPAWSSFMTGKNPGKHGVFHFSSIDDRPSNGATEEVEIVDGRSIKSATLWDVLGHHGYNVGLINVPMSYPPRPVNGFMITGLLTPPSAPIFTYPPELSDQVPASYEIDLDRFIDQKPFAKNEQGVKEERVVKPSLTLMDEFIQMEQERGRLALQLMDSQPWDAFMVVFTASDRMGHYLWNYHRTEDLDDSDESQVLHEAIVNFYKEQDKLIDDLVKAAGPDTTVLIMSDHGMGPIHTKITHWNNWLYKEGYLKLDKASSKSPDGWLLRFGLPRDKIGRLARRLPGFSSSRAFRKMKTARTAKIDFTASRAYYTRIFDPVGGIRVNHEGPGKKELIDKLLSEVRQVVDPATGQKIVRWAYSREECYWGPYTDQMPDIILVLQPDYGSSNRVSNYSAIATDRPYIRDPGGHHMEGIFVATGPQVTQRGEPVEDLNIVDVAPTVLYLMGLPIPEDMDGRVITEIIDPAVLKQRPVTRDHPRGLWPSEAGAHYNVDEPQGEEDEVVRERLRALGYFD